MKNIIIVGILSFQLLFAPDIVYDPIHTAKTLAESMETAKRWVQEIEHYKSQLVAYEKELLSQTEIRATVQFTKEIGELYAFTQEFALDFLDLKEDILGLPKSRVGQLTKELFEKYTIFDNCKFIYMSIDQKRICKNRMIRNVQELATYQHYKKNLSSISTNLQDLSIKLADAKDIKESQDIQNAIQVQIAHLQVTQAQVELMDTQNRSLARIEQRQKEQIYKEKKEKRIDWNF